jgi:hypothetical protein
LAEEPLLKCSLNLFIVKKKIIFLLLGTTSLVLSIKQEAKGHEINPSRVRLMDTLIVSANLNVKAVEAKSDSSHHIVYHAPIMKREVSFGPGDPDATAPLSAVPDSVITLRARSQMKAYLDNLIIDPKSIGLLKNAKDLFEREIDDSLVNSGHSINALRQAILVPLK